MAKFVLKDASVTINSVDLSDRVASVTLDISADIVDLSAMSDTYKEKGAGLLDWSMSVEFRQDFGASNVDATLFPLLGVSTTVIVLPTSGGVSATNPTYTGTAILSSYPPIGGGVGDGASSSASFDGTGPLVRAEV